MTYVYIAGDVWGLIENFDHFTRRWRRALKRRRFFLVRYAGTDRWVNPRAISMASNFEL
jgi:hypothetical protein